MEENKMRMITGKKLVLLLLLYFVGYVVIVPILSRSITLWLDPAAVMVNIPVAVSLYTIVLLSALLIAKDLWKDSIRTFQRNIKKGIGQILLMTLLALTVNYVVSVITALLSGAVDSSNQEIIKENITVAPLFMLYSTVIFAPIVEETVFRGGIFTFCRKRLGFLPAGMISAALFGAIHVMDSIVMLDMSDLLYFFVYAALGFVFCYCYEKGKGICIGAGVHAANNLLSFLLLTL